MFNTTENSNPHLLTLQIPILMRNHDRHFGQLVPTKWVLITGSVSRKIIYYIYHGISSKMWEMCGIEKVIVCCGIFPGFIDYGRQIELIVTLE